MSRFLRYLPLLAPIFGAGVIYAVMRPDAIMARPDVPSPVGRLVYDESDLTAFALRGLNADLGRPPGRADQPVEPDWKIPPVTLPRWLLGPQPPLAEKYYLEYPTPVLPLFLLGYAGQPPLATDDVPSTLADAHQFSVAFHEPQNPAESRLWTRMRDAIRVYVGVMAVALVGLMLVVGRGYEPGRGWGGPVWLAALPGAVFFALNRFDVLPALATAAAFACLGRGYRGWAGVALGVGTALKLYPVLFVPVFLRFLGPRDGVRFLIGLAVAVGAAFGGSVAWLGVDSTLGPVVVQMSRTHEPGWTFYNRVLPLELADMKAARLGLLIAAVLATVVTRPRTIDAVLRRCGLSLIVFLSLAVFWSPQWVLWFLPLFIPLGRTRWWPIAAAVVLDVWTYYTFPGLLWNVWGYSQDTWNVVSEVVVYFRAVLWGAVAVGFIRDEWTAGRRADPVRIRAGFAGDRSAWLAAFLATAGKGGTPRGLDWVGVEPLGEARFVRDAGGAVLALVPVEVRFSPVPGSDMMDVPQAREPRPVVAVIRYDADTGLWRTDGRAVFNLSPEQVIERGRYLPLE